MQTIKKKYNKGILWLILSSVIFLMSMQQSGMDEYQIKSAFLLNFTYFVEWPSSSFTSAKSPLIIGIYGKDPFGNYLEEVTKGEVVNGRQILIKRYNNTDEVASCHLLFINSTSSSKTEQVMNNIRHKRILSVGEASDFLEQGGMIRFVKKNKKIQFQINPEEIKASDLSVSSKLLRLAEIVVPRKNN